MKAKAKAKTKKCNTCGESKVTTDFYRKTSRSGLNYECKICTRARAAANKADKLKQEMGNPLIMHFILGRQDAIREHRKEEAATGNI